MRSGLCTAASSATGPSTGTSTNTMSRTVDGPVLATVMVYSAVDPAAIVAGPVLTIEMSDWVSVVSMSSSELSSVLTSPVPAPTVTVAVFVTSPGGVSSRPGTVLNTGAVTVITTALSGPGYTVTSVSMFPVCGAVAVQLDKPDGTHCQCTFATSNKAGSKTSSTWLSAANAGPAFVTVMVYVVVWPGVTTSTPLLLVIDRSTTGALSDDLAVWLLLSSFGSNAVASSTVAVLAIGSGPA